jgi:hypothetical protein
VWIAFFLGLFLGASVGIVMMSLCHIARRQNECMECQEATLRKWKKANDATIDTTVDSDHCSQMSD